MEESNSENNSVHSQIVINRSAYNTKSFDQTYKPTPKPSFLQQAKSTLNTHCRFDPLCLGKSFLARFPIVEWVYTYRLRKFIFGDIIAGITVTLLHIPQGMAYAQLAHQHAVFGLYTCMMFSFVYAIFGTSRHLSLGTFAVISLLTSNAVTELTTVSGSACFAGNSTNGTSFNTTSQNATSSFSPETYVRIEIASTLTFLIGCILLIFGFLRFGFISTLLSRPFVRGYIAGAGVHVFVAQINTLIGIQVCTISSVELFKVPNSLYQIGKHIVSGNVNWLAIVISIICIIFLYLSKFLNDFLQKKKFPIPLPSQIFVIVIFTLVSHFANLNAEFGLEVIGFIPRGLPSPALPNPSYFLPLIDNAVIIAVVSYSIGISIAEVIADQNNYVVDSNQEMVAFGMCHVVGSLFFNIPGGASLSRTLTQSSTGGKTQLVSILAGLIILLCLVAIAPFLEPLPTSVLSAIVIVALHGIYMQVLDIPHYWKVSKYDLFIWITTFLCTAIINVEIGLLCGIAVSLLVFVVRTIVVFPVLLGNLPSTELYVNAKEFEGVTLTSSVKVIRHASPLYFANAPRLKNFILSQLPLSTEKEKITGCGPELHKRIRDGDCKRGSKHTRIQTSDRKETLENIPSQNEDEIHFTTANKICVILDCSCIPFIDSVGGTILCDVNKHLTKKDHLFYLSGMSRGVREDLMRASGGKWENLLECSFPSIQDALSATPIPNELVPLNENVISEPEINPQGVQQTSI